jgi:hypothetical protein
LTETDKKEQVSKVIKEKKEVLKETKISLKSVLKKNEFLKAELKEKEHTILSTRSLISEKEQAKATLESLIPEREDSVNRAN